MDYNKLLKLKEINYSIIKTCGLCQHGFFPNNDWGTCQINSYNHIKHSNSFRQLSIHKSGYCINFIRNNDVVLGSYEEFIEEEIK